MNGLMPPERRPMPGDRSQTLRTFLQDEADPVRSPRRRPYVPALVAAAVAAIAIGGYVTATQLGEEGSEPSPTGQLSQDPKPNPEPERGQIPQGDPTLNQLTEGSGHADAEQRCLDAIERDYERGYGPPPDLSDLEAKIIAESVEMTTVVVSDGADLTLTCNVDPDSAVSRGGWDGMSPMQRLFDYAQNATVNYGMGPGTLAWSGGTVPDGFETVTYVFANGTDVEADVEDGYWAMQYLTEGNIPWHGNRVLLDGPAGQEIVELSNMSGCNQISHGC